MAVAPVASTRRDDDDGGVVCRRSLSTLERIKKATSFIFMFMVGTKCSREGAISKQEADP